MNKNVRESIDNLIQGILASIQSIMKNTARMNDDELNAFVERLKDAELELSYIEDEISEMSES